MYTSKKVSNMFYVTLVDMLANNERIITSRVRLFPALQLIEQQSGFIKFVKHTKGLIVQIEKKLYNDAKNINILNICYSKSLNNI